MRNILRKAHYAYIIGIILCLTSCNHHSKEWEKLKDVESYIEEKPDSALSVLQNIDTGVLSNQEEKAKYALLLSMAMDKNFIDRTDFEVLQPAIDYYQNYSNATDKLRTSYYEGRIYTNQGDNASAIICFNKALNEGKESEDILTKARIHFVQASIYKSLYKWDSFIEENKQAAEYFKQAKLQNSYANCLIRIINGYIIQNDKENAEKYIRLCEPILDSVSMKRQIEFYVVNLLYFTKYGTKENLILALNKYQATVPEAKLDWISISNAYLALNDYQTALYYIQRYQLTSNVDQNMRYYALIYKIYEKSGHQGKALESYINYSNIADSIDLATYRQTTQFIEEYHKIELQTMEEREKSEKIIFLSIIIVLALLSVCIWIRIRLFISVTQKKHLENENERYRLQCLQIEEERDNLTELLSKNKEMSESAQTALTQRIAFLNKFFATYIKNKGEVDCVLKKEIEDILADRDSFMDSTRLAFIASHPAFIQYLQDKGLTEWEINYCCLYALGLKGKEVGAYIKMRSHYNQSSIIREKLGINEHETNLGIYLCKLLKEYSV